MNPTSSGNLFNKMNPDFLASSLLKRQVTYRAGLLSPWIEASYTASIAPLKKIIFRMKVQQGPPPVQHHLQRCKMAREVPGQVQLSANMPETG